MPVRAMGPTYAGGTQPIVEGGYNLTFLPDVNNWELQKGGQSPVFYWVPNQVRIARKDGPSTGDHLFNLIRFSGVQSEDSTVGATENREVAGGVLTFTVTGAPPDEVLQQAQEQITEQYQTSDDFFWGIRSNRPPIFRPAILASNTTSISNVSPTPSGLIPTPSTTEGARGNSGGIRMLGTDSLRSMDQGKMTRSVRTRDAAESNIDPWFWRMQGEGSGSIDPSGQNAFSALLGAYPTAIMWESFHGTASPVVVMQDMQLKVWSPVVDLRIEGEWESVYEHFSANVRAKYLWASADIKAEFNNMRKTGAITVELKIDATIPNGEKLLENIEKRSDLIFEKFMEEARNVIFSPPPPEVEAAEASSPSGPWGVSVALNYRRDSTKLKLEYHEVRQLAYLQQHVVSSSLGGFFDEIRGDPEVEKKYFRTVYLSDWPAKLVRVVQPIVPWQDKTVKFVSCSLGYPRSGGDIKWEGKSFNSPEGVDESWKYRIEQKELSDVTTPPQGWAPGKTFLKRTIYLNEPPSELDDPYFRLQIDANKIDLDPGPNGILVNDNIIEVRADTAGRFAVGPIGLGVVLQDNTQTVEVQFDPTDGQNPPNSIGREPIRFIWNHDDQDRDRMWMLFTGDPELLPSYRYKVRVIIKGTIFEPGREWEGPWIGTNGNGPITIKIPSPTPDNTRAMPTLFASSSKPVEVRGVPTSEEGVETKAKNSEEDVAVKTESKTNAIDEKSAVDVKGWKLAPE